MGDREFRCKVPGRCRSRTGSREAKRIRWVDLPLVLLTGFLAMRLIVADDGVSATALTILCSLVILRWIQQARRNAEYQSVIEDKIAKIAEGGSVVRGSQEADD